MSRITGILGTVTVTNRAQFLSIKAEKKSVATHCWKFDFPRQVLGQLCSSVANCFDTFRVLEKAASPMKYFWLPWPPGFQWSLPAPPRTRVRLTVSCSGRPSRRCRTSWASQWSTLRWCSNRPPPILELRFYGCCYFFWFFFKKRKESKRWVSERLSLGLNRRDVAWCNATAATSVQHHCHRVLLILGHWQHLKPLYREPTRTFCVRAVSFPVLGEKENTPGVKSLDSSHQLSCPAVKTHGGLYVLEHQPAPRNVDTSAGYLFIYLFAAFAADCMSKGLLPLQHCTTHRPPSTSGLIN